MQKNVDGDTIVILKYCGCRYTIYSHGRGATDGGSTNHTLPSSSRATTLADPACSFSSFFALGNWAKIWFRIARSSWVKSRIGFTMGNRFRRKFGRRGGQKHDRPSAGDIHRAGVETGEWGARDSVSLIACSMASGSAARREPCPKVISFIGCRGRRSRWNRSAFRTRSWDRPDPPALSNASEYAAPSRSLSRTLKLGH